MGLGDQRLLLRDRLDARLTAARGPVSFDSELSGSAAGADEAQRERGVGRTDLGRGAVDRGGVPPRHVDDDREQGQGRVGAVVDGEGAGCHTAVEDVSRAVRRATLERRPISVSLPIDLQEQTCEAEWAPAELSSAISEGSPTL